MAARFKLDENLPRDALTLLVRAGHNAHSVIDERLGGGPDREVLKACRRGDRILITLNPDFADVRQRGRGRGSVACASTSAAMKDANGAMFANELACSRALMTSARRSTGITVQTSAAEAGIRKQESGANECKTLLPSNSMKKSQRPSVRQEISDQVIPAEAGIQEVVGCARRGFPRTQPPSGVIGGRE